MKLDKKDHTAYDKKGGRLYFLTHEFKDGCFLGYWSGCPRGCVHDQDRGWVVISKKGELLESLQTYESGPVPRFGDESFADWRKRQKLEHGLAKGLKDTQGNQMWKMGD